MATKVPAKKEQFKEQIHKCNGHIFLSVYEELEAKIFQIDFAQSSYSYSSSKNYSTPTETHAVDFKNCPYCGKSLYEWETIE